MARFESRSGLAVAAWVLCAWQGLLIPSPSVVLGQETGVPATVTPFEQEIREDLVRFPRALAAADQEALLARYLPDPPPSLFYPGPAADQFQVQGWASTKSFWETYFKTYRHVQLRFNAEPTISLLGGGAVATNTFSYESTQVSESKKLYAYGRITVVYKKVDGHPYVIHEHLSYLAGPPRLSPAP